MKTALITGITGQDGAYLAQLLLDKGYLVYGTHRRTSSRHFWRIEDLGIATHPQLCTIEHDLTDLSSTIRLLRKVRPTEIYNLAAQSVVGVSFDQPLTTFDIDGRGVVHILEAIRIVDTTIRFVQASTSEMFGNSSVVPQREDTPFHPRNPYGSAKLYAHWMAINYRECYRLFAVSAIMFNHESPLRGKEFVTRKVSDAVARICLGKLDVLEVGNLDAVRDWGDAREYVEGMWRMLQARAPDTFVLATNRVVTLREFVSMAFHVAGIPIRFEGTGQNERGIDILSGKTVVRVNTAFARPPERNVLMGDAGKARASLGWMPKIAVESLCRRMVETDLKRNEWGASF